MTIAPLIVVVCNCDSIETDIPTICSREGLL